MSNQPEAVRQPVICLLGPTASGKTEAALKLHARGDIDIVSVDSALVYRGMNIGTAKPSPELLADVPHALVDICDPEMRYSVADFLRDAQRCIAASHAAGRIPVLVGGTMLYFKRLFDGLAQLPDANPAIRAEIDRAAEQLGWMAMHRRLADIDPAAAQRIAPADTQRIQRALEVHAITGRAITELQLEAAATPSDYAYLKIALIGDDRAALHERIARRFDDMLEGGFEDEVRGLLARPGLERDASSMRSVGYRQIAGYLAGETSRAQAIADAKTATRRLAKRQHTWLRGMAGLQRVDPLEVAPFTRISDLVEAFVT